MRVLLFLSLFITNISFAQGQKSVFKDKDKKYIDEANFKRYQGVLLEDEALIPGKNYTTGIIESDYYTQKDNFRMNFMALFNPNIRKLSSLTSLEVMAAKNFNWFWLEGFFSATSAQFSEIMDNRSAPNFSNPDAEGNFFRDENVEQKLATFGFGMGHRSRWLQEFFNARDLFEHVAAYLTYHSLTDGGRNLNYAGPGFRADFGIHKRISSLFHIGVNLSYNLGIVDRDKITEAERKEDRTFVLSWISIGADLGFYF